MTERYDLLILVKRAGKRAGFTPRMIQLLDYYVNFTKDIDWQGDQRPIVYQSLSKTALDLGVNERQIQRLEKSLADLGAIGFYDSGNHKRYGQRDRAGQIKFAFGVDLSPLKDLKDKLQNILNEKHEHDTEWMETKRQISHYRAQIRRNIDGDAELIHEYEQIAVQIRTHIKLDDLKTLLADHKTLFEKTRKESCSNAKKDVHNNTDINKLSDKSGNNALTEAGLQHITLNDALSIAPEGIKDHLPLTQSTWADFIEAAYKHKRQLNIKQQHWNDACKILGRSGAAICVILADRAEFPNAYFKSLITRAGQGDLHLHKSVFGLNSTLNSTKTNKSHFLTQPKPLFYNTELSQ